VNVRREHANCAPGRSRNTFGPQLTRQVLDEVRGYTLVCVPRRNQRLLVHYGARFLMLFTLINTFV
jgi:hypothetical protein